ncbi:MAG: 50S ribosomal protein L28 [Rickettsiales bacterium]|jgi:large subunit ribosomal protein L28|nr:50S ribosomal protein L28 [Rickettsiales bacterium]
MSRVCELTNIGVQAGHSVSNSNIKTKKRFLPNLKYVSLKSEVLSINVNLRIAAKTIRTINKYGDLDSFLINYGYNKLSEKGKKLRQKVQKKLLEQNKLDGVKIVKNKKVSA